MAEKDKIIHDPRDLHKYRRFTVLTSDEIPKRWQEEQELVRKIGPASPRTNPNLLNPHWEFSEVQ